MNRLRFIRGFLRTLIGLSDRTSPWWGIDRGVMNDIERARFRRMYRAAGGRSDLFRPVPETSR